MDEAEVKFEMRLWALELVVVNLLATIAISDSDPNSLLAKTHQGMIDGARKRGFQGFDAAESQLLSDELEAALSRLLAMAYEQIRHGRGNHEE